MLLEEIFEIYCCFVRTHESMRHNFWCFFQKTLSWISKQTKQMPAHSKSPSEPKTTTATPTSLPGLAVQCLTPCPSAPFMQSRLRRGASKCCCWLAYWYVACDVRCLWTLPLVLFIWASPYPLLMAQGNSCGPRWYLYLCCWTVNMYKSFLINAWHNWGDNKQIKKIYSNWHCGWKKCLQNYTCSCFLLGLCSNCVFTSFKWMFTYIA